MSAQKNPLVILTGLSGAGLSTAMKVLEDQGYHAFDNFPLKLLPALFAETPAGQHPVALVVDSRADDFHPDQILHVVRDLRAQADRDVSLVFMTADEAVLVKRFTETRRRHPLASDRPIEDGIRKEQHLMYSLRLESDVVIDTSELSVHDLKRLLVGHLGKDHQVRPLTITVQSFSFRRGIPREADLVFDARFLNNPHWDAACRPLTGRDALVQEYVDRDPDFAPFISHLQQLLAPLLPRYKAEGKSYLTIAVGCTGGKHRSVYTAEKLSKWLKDQGFSPFLVHRELERQV